MKYQSGGAFRRALEQHLRTQSLQTGVPLVRLRKTVTFDRFLARLFRTQPADWVVKGGLDLTRVPCYPVTQQIAEKLHAYTRPHKMGESSRVMDFIDIILMAELGDNFRRTTFPGNPGNLFCPWNP